MMKGRRSLGDSQAPSPEGSEDDEARSPVSDEEELRSPTIESKSSSARGRKPKMNFLRDELKKDPLDLVH